VSFIRTSLTELDDKMIDLDSDIKAFNFFVQTQVKSLAARGETSSDLLINLFKGYKVADDSEFQNFIRPKENEYKEGYDV
jgi:rhamnose utilization protein RhaD (predicted bifunctional aldolase and dehydrogenase)